MELPDTTINAKEQLVVERYTRSSENDEGVTRSNGVEKYSGERVPPSEDHSEEQPRGTLGNEIFHESTVEISTRKSLNNSLQRPHSKDEENADDENVCIDSNSRSLTILFPSSWSECLKSPTDSLGFSPSELGGSHGIGLQIAAGKNTSTALFLGNVSFFLSSIATFYEQLGISLLKLTQFLGRQQLLRETSINDNFEMLHQEMLSLGNGFRSSAVWHRTSIIAPLKKLLSTNATERDIALKQYTDSKQACVEARKSALSNYSRMTNATTTAEYEAQAWLLKLKQKSNLEIDVESEEITETNEDLPWEKSLKLIGKKKNEQGTTSRLVQKLKLLQSCREQYSESVERENNCVKLAEENELFALKRTQKAEEDFINFFFNNVLSQVFSDDENGESLIARKEIAMSDTDRPFTEGFEKKGIELLSNLNLFRQQSIPYEEGMGVMDAETLGLSEAIGIQRDKIKLLLSARENRIEVAEIVVKLFEEITSTTSKSTSRMLSQISSQRRKDESERQNSESFSSSPGGFLWRATLCVFEDEANLIYETAFKISKLENWLATSKRALEGEIEMDDAAWKRACDAARVEMKLDSRYKQTKQHIEKVRQRASSKELALSQRGSSDSSDDTLQLQRKRNNSSGPIGITNRSISGIQSTPNRVGRAFFKGGEAMKKLTENAMVQIAQISMNEVDQKEAKDQLALEEARMEKNNAVLAYASCTKERIEKIDEEDNSGWTEMKEIVFKLVESFRALKKARCIVFQNRVSQELGTSFDLLVTSMEKWCENTRVKMYTREQVSYSASSSGHSLSLQSIKSESIDPLLCMTEADLTIPEVIFDFESSNEQLDGRAVKNQDGILPAGREVEKDSNSDDNITMPQKLIITKPDHDKGDCESRKENHQDITHTDVSTHLGKERSKEVEAFIKQFWSKKPKELEVPDVLEMHMCAYRPKERITFLTPNLQGMLYITKDAIYFLAAEKNFTLQWETIISVEKEKGFMGSYNENDLVVSYHSGNNILSFLLCRLRERDIVVEYLKKLKAENEMSNIPVVPSASLNQPPSLPPDTLLETMEIVLARKIKNVSIRSVFENVWADGTESESFYGSWLSSEECFDIGIGEWEIADSGEKFKNEWCAEKYDQQRLVSFKFNRTTHLYIGPPVAFVKQRHFLRVEDNDRCVIAISAEFEGIPYADSFAVEMRWVATRTGTQDILVQVGLFVNFKKHTMLKSQIKSGTITETKNVHLRLFDAVKRACTTLQNGESVVDYDKDDKVEEEMGTNVTKPNLFSIFGRFISFPSHAFSLMGIVAFVFAGRYITVAISGSSNESDIRRLENYVQELRQDIHRLDNHVQELIKLQSCVQVQT